MTTQANIDRTLQQLAKFERSLSLAKVKQRKADTRRKIQLGGLVVKAKMADYSKAAILGALLDALEQIEKDPSTLNWYQQKGEAAFLGYGDK